MTTKQLRELLGPEPLIQVDPRQLSALASKLRVDLARVDRAIECLEALNQSPLRRGGPGSFKLVIRERTAFEVDGKPEAETSAQRRA